MVYFLHLHPSLRHLDILPTLWVEGEGCVGHFWDRTGLHVGGEAIVWGGKCISQLAHTIKLHMLTSIRSFNAYKCTVHTPAVVMASSYIDVVITKHKSFLGQ